MATDGLSARDFVHLHNHTQYSLLDGLSKIPALIAQVQDFGMDAIAITDHGTLSGAIEFYQTADASDVKPIIGMETYVAARKHTDKDVSKDKQNYHLILLAMNNKGYENLMRLSTIANLDGMYYKPRVDHDLLEKYNEGLIVLSGCIGGEVGDALRQEQYDQAKETALWYKSVFGDRYYFELQDHGHPDHPNGWDEQQRVNKELEKLSKELDIPPVVTCDAHYLRHEDQEAHEILLCVQTGSFLSDQKRMSLKEFDLHVNDPREVIERWQDTLPEAVTNTRAIAERCDVKLEFGKILIPKFDVPEGETEKTHLDTLVYQGLTVRYGNIAPDAAEKLSVNEAKSKLPVDIQERAAFELGVINDMGFNGYFLIIADFMNWGKEQGIVFGPGRGSAAGSIIAYALKITELDPLEYDLLFERFLNPDRISMPDIDIDIQDTRRDEVIQYCADKYGHDHVANIVTFGRMAARNAVRDVSRVLQVPYAEADRLAKMIPAPIQGRHIPLATSLEEDPDLKNEYQASEQSKRVFDLAMRLEGTIRSHGVHAAGVVIAPDDIVKFVPLEMAQKGVVSTQYSMNPVEDLGLLKMDFLGLSNLTIINNALRIIRKVYGTDIDVDALPLEDELTYKLFQRGDTTGVFQLESAGMKRYLKALKPTTFEDIVAMVALYRPGPMQFIDDFIARKHGQTDITYPHDSMAPALENTYGVLVYQEQVMQISKDVCGFSGGDADTLRKAIGKKKADLMAKMKDKMIQGGQEHSGIDKALMEKFWRQLEDFAAYCFNKSHAACYALIAYQTAYLKAHYPAAFMAALMTSDYDDTDRLAIEISECQHMGIEVLPPSVNESFLEFAVVPPKKGKKANQVRFGMNAIKNVGTGAVEEILRARKDAPFENLEDFLTRVSPRIVNKKSLESLIKAGAFDQLGDRLQLVSNIETLLAFSSRMQKAASTGQTDLFGSVEDASVQVSLSLAEAEHGLSDSDSLKWERELLGVYLSRHPLEDYKDLLDEKTIPLKELKPQHDGRHVAVGGLINEAKTITTKNGQKMAFVRMSDELGETELLVFPSTFQQTIGTWEVDNVVLVSGKVNARDANGGSSADVKIAVEDARVITYEQAKAYEPTGKKQKVPKPSKSKPKQVQTDAGQNKPDERLYIRMSDSSDQESLAKLKTQLDAHQGGTEVVLVIGPPASKQILKLPQKIALSPELTKSIKEVFGSENIRVQ